MAKAAWESAPVVDGGGPAWMSAPEVGSAPEQPVAQAPAVKSAPLTRTDRFVKGLRDPIDGGAQLLTNMLPEGVVSAGNRLNNWLADNTGLVGRLPEGGVDQQVREAEQAYQARRAASEPTSLTSLVTGQKQEPGFDGYRVLGNILNPANLGLARALPVGATLGSRIGLGVLGGAASSGLNPVTSGDFTEEKLKQLAIGGATGGALPAVTGAVARVVRPNASANPQVQALRAEGVRPTLGQTLGGVANSVEEKASSIPIVGDMISNARRGAAADLNKAAFNRALKPVGKELPKGVTGRDAVQFTEEAISDGYNKLLPGLTVKSDKAFASEIQNLRQMVNTGSLDPNSAKAFNRILQNDVLGKFKGQGALTGETFKAIESDLSNNIKRFAGSQDADQRLVGDALQEVQSSLRKMLERSNPGKSKELGALNSAWANFKRVQKASASLGAEDGIFSPAQLQSAVKAADRSKDKARFARGDALMQDLSEAGKTVLGNKVPDSGTAGRLLTAGGASLLDPSGIAPLALGSTFAAYSRPAQSLLTALVAERPEAANAIAQALRQGSPALVPAAAQIGIGLSQ